MNVAALKYSWLTYRRDQLWFPLAFLAVFILIIVVMRHPEIRLTLVRGYLGFMLPLIGGITASYALLDDPALELRFATPVRAGQTLLARVGLILAVQAVCALAFQIVAAVLGVDFSLLGGVIGVQLIWFLPTLSLAALGTVGSLAGAQTVMGAFLVGAVWLLQVMMKSWLMTNAKYVYLFLRALEPDDPSLSVNQGVLFIGALALLFASWVLLHDQERFI